MTARKQPLTKRLRSAAARWKPLPVGELLDEAATALELARPPLTRASFRALHLASFPSEQPNEDRP